MRTRRYVDSQRETSLVPIELSLHGDDSVSVRNSGLAQGETVTQEEPQQAVWKKWLFTPPFPTSPMINITKHFSFTSQSHSETV